MLLRIRLSIFDQPGTGTNAGGLLEPGTCRAKWLERYAIMTSRIDLAGKISLSDLSLTCKVAGDDSPGLAQEKYSPFGGTNKVFTRSLQISEVYDIEELDI